MTSQSEAKVGSVPPEFDIGVTGTREGMTKKQTDMLIRRLRKFRPGRLHHGMCVGVDVQTHRYARTLGGWWIIGHPPINQTQAKMDLDVDEMREPGEYLARNHELVDEVGLLFVVPKQRYEILRSGTWATFRYARKQGIRIEVLWP